MADRVGTQATCRSCQAPFWWAVTEATGALIPINAPDPGGNLAVRRVDSGELVARVLTDAAPVRPAETVTTSHFATCTAPDAHRRRGRPDGDQPDLFGRSP